MPTVELDLFRTPAADPKLEQLLRHLDNRDWQSAKQLEAALGRDFNDRKIRVLASNSEGQILSGQKGYKLTRQATPDERDHAINWLNSQARKMQQRAAQISKVHRS